MTPDTPAQRREIEKTVAACPIGMRACNECGGYDATRATNCNICGERLPEKRK